MVEDSSTNFTSSITKYGNRILLTYPYILYSKSKFVIPYLVLTLCKIIDNYNEYVYNRSVRTGLICIDLINANLNKNDKEILKMRMNILCEETANDIYTTVSKVVDQDKLILFNFRGLYNSFLKVNSFKKYNDNYADIYDIFHINVFFMISKYGKAFLCANKLQNNDIFLVDESFRDFFEEKILEFYCFIYEINKLNLHKHEVTSNKRIPNVLNHSTKQNSQIDNIISFKKSSLKPYDKTEILITNTCEVDYGNKRVTKKEIKKREQFIKTSINKANKILEMQFEDEIIKSTFNKENTKRVLFSIPHNKERILNKISSTNN